MHFKCIDKIGFDRIDKYRRGDFTYNFWFKTAADRLPLCVLIGAIEDQRPSLGSNRSALLW